MLLDVFCLFILVLFIFGRGPQRRLFCTIPRVVKVNTIGQLTVSFLKSGVMLLDPERRSGHGDQLSEFVGVASFIEAVSSTWSIFWGGPWKNAVSFR